MSIARCAACGEPVSHTDQGGCVGSDPAYHFTAECLLEAARRADARLEGAVEAIRKAPHARHCEAGASMWPGPCTCWKRKWLDPPTTSGEE